MSHQEKKPDCFGDWAVVFPQGPEGLRSVTVSCQPCPWVKACLRVGSETSPALEMRASRLAGLKTPSRSGLTGFLDRWSRLKQLRRNAENKRTRRWKK